MCGNLFEVSGLGHQGLTGVGIAACYLGVAFSDRADF